GPAPGRSAVRSPCCLRGQEPPGRREVALLKRRQLDARLLKRRQLVLRLKALVAYRALCRRSSCRRRSRFTGLSAEVPPHGAVGGGAGSPLRAQLQAFGLGILGQVDHDGVTVDDVTGQQRAGQLVADLALDQATQRSGAEGRIVAFEGQPVLGPLSDLE